MPATHEPSVSGPATASHPPTPRADLDALLTAQIGVAWAGESGEERRLSWWRSDLTGTMGGEDLFKQILPETWPWATLQAARAAAARRDASLRARDHAPDALLSLFMQGFAVDELATERLRELKQSGQSPLDALPGLRGLIDSPWNRDGFQDWLGAYQTPPIETTPVGRRIKGPAPEGLDQRVRQLLGALVPLADDYPLPHHRRAA